MNALTIVSTVKARCFSLANRVSRFEKTILLIIVVVGFFVWSDVLLDRKFPVVRDSAEFQLEGFWFASQSLLETRTAPTWAPMGHGVPLALLSNNYCLLAPWRAVGLLDLWLARRNVVDAYKLAFFVGLAGVVAGIFFLGKEVSGNVWIAAAISSVAMVSGVGFGNFHQEQSIGSLFWLPWILLCLLRGARLRQPWLLVSAWGLAGAACVVHYPQIPLLFLVAVVVAFVATGQWRSLVPNNATWCHWALGALAFIVISSPTWIAAWRYAGDYGSPMRASQELFASSYEQYLEMNRLGGNASAPPQYLAQYLAIPNDPEAFKLDNYAVFLGRLTVILAVAAAFARGKKARPFLIVVVLTALLMVGVNGFAPYVLLHVLGPIISMFRQWYHFQVTLNLALLMCAAIGAIALLQSARDWSLARKLAYFAVVLVLLIPVNSSLNADADWVMPLALCAALGVYLFTAAPSFFAWSALIVLGAVDLGNYVGLTKQGIVEYAAAHPASRQQEYDELSIRAAQTGVVRPPLSAPLLVEHREIAALKARDPNNFTLNHPNGVFVRRGDYYVAVTTDKDAAPGRVRFTSNSDAARTVHITTVYDKNWRLTINGEAETIRRGENACMEFVVPSGNHRVELEYRDSVWVTSVAAHALALIALVSLTFFVERRATRLPTSS